MRFICNIQTDVCLIPTFFYFTGIFRLNPKEELLFYFNHSQFDPFQLARP